MDEKFDLKIENNGTEAFVKPFIMNALAGVSDALISGMQKLPEDIDKLEKTIILDKEDVLLAVGEKNIHLNSFVVGMFKSTLRGFISTLDEFPDTPEEFSTITVKMSYKKLEN